MTTTPGPVRIQRRREKGWRMPEGSVYVGRPSRWGNPFRTGQPFLSFYPPLTAALAVRLYEGLTTLGTFPDITPLRGRDLACWCPLDQPCHADVLLELANRATPGPVVGA